MDRPKCGADSDFAAWLDRVTFASLFKKWIVTACPACGYGYEIRLLKNGAILGAMDGAPGPAFIPYKTHKIPGLSVDWSENAVRIRHVGRNWKFPTQQSLLPPAR